jgi:hypothetical protein
MQAVPFTVEELRQWLDYDPATGVLTWKVRRGRSKVGQRAGFVDKSNGYRKLCLRGVNVSEHRLIFLLVTGNWPTRDIDHINNDKEDNRWVNLREATKSQNVMNVPKRADNSSGFKGVIANGSKWRAFVKVEGRLTWLGSFDTFEEAVAERVKAAEEHYGEFAKHG